MESHTVPPHTSKKRFSDYAVGKFENLPSRKSVKKAIKLGLLMIDGEKATTGRWINAGMEITLIEQELAKKVYELDIPVIYEDDYLAIVNKPAGLTTSGNIFKTLENTLLFNLKPSLLPDAYQYPKPVHRLDRATSGLVIVAKTKGVRIKLGEMLEKGLINKIYTAVVRGKITPKTGQIETPMEGKRALTLYEVLNEDEKYSLLKMIPKTGRTHQLRIHCAESGFPIVGDPLYNERNKGPGKGLFLCASRLAFKHPVLDMAVEVRIDMPKKFMKLMKNRHY